MPANAYYLLWCQSEHGILFDLFHATDSNDQKFSERKIHNEPFVAKKQCKSSVALIFYSAFNNVLTALMNYYD